MTILAVGGEDESVEVVSGQSFNANTTSGTFDATVSRCSLGCQQGVSEIYLPFGTTPTDMWLHFRAYLAANVANADMVLLENASGSTGVFKIGMNSDKSWTLYKYKTGAWSALASSTAAATVLENAAADFDLHVVVGASGSATLYKNGAAIISFTGDTTVDQTLGRVHFKGQTNIANLLSISQIIVATAQTLGQKLATIAANGNSAANTAWGNDYTKISGTDFNTGNVIQTAVTGALETYPGTDLDVSLAGYTVQAVVVAARVSNDASSAVADVQAVIRESSTNYPSSNLSLTKDGSYHMVQSVFTNDPATSAAWTQAAVNALEFGLKSV